MVQGKKESAGGRKAPYSVVVSADTEPERWLEERRKLLTATDVPSILGVPGARSALETWYQKKDALVARAESDAIREARQAGHDFEDSNALMFSKATGRYIERSQQLVRSNRHPWLGCTLDYVQNERHGVDILLPPKDPPPWRPLELKNAGSHAASDMWPVGGEPHLTWQVQVHTQMSIMDVEQGSLSAWLGAPYVHHRWCDVEHDRELETIILEESERFWKSLKRKAPPTREPHADDYAVLRRLDPNRTTGKVISLPVGAPMIHDNILAHEALVERAKAQYDDAKALLELSRSQMARLIGSNAGGKLKDGTTWMFRQVQVPAHAVAAYSYRTLQRVTKTKPRKTTWKTSK